MYTIEYSHSLFLSICGCNGLESTTALGGDCLESIPIPNFLSLNATNGGAWLAEGAPDRSPMKKTTRTGTHNKNE
jgi:hypothetical protein